MLKVLVADSPEGHYSSFVTDIAAHGDIDVVGQCQTGHEVAIAARKTEIDAFVFPVEWSELCRAIQLSSETPVFERTSLIVAAQTISKPVLVKAYLYGFDGAVALDHGPAAAVSNISAIVEGRVSLLDNPVFHNLDVTPGLLARNITIPHPDDEDLAHLVGVGLPDDAIARVMGWSIQQVRNRIENLLATNDLMYRTQLAVLCASVCKVPDFT